MYMNRLRASDYHSIFANAGLEILDVTNVVNSEVRLHVESGELPLAARFRGMSAEDLVTTEILVVARPAQAGN